MAPVLVIDTALDACTVGLFSSAGDALLAQTQTMARGQQEALGQMAEAAFAESGISPKNLSKIAVTLGPGSFTGLRIGLSFAKGLAAGAGVPLLGFGTLEALGAFKPLRDKRRLITMDGGRGVFYVQVFSTDAPATPPEAIRPDDPVAARTFLNGLGEIDVISGPAADVIAPFIPQAAVVAQSVPSAEALFALAANAVPPYVTTPIYMREADAKPSTRPQLKLV